MPYRTHMDDELLIRRTMTNLVLCGIGMALIAGAAIAALSFVVHIPGLS